MGLFKVRENKYREEARGGMREMQATPAKRKEMVQ